MRLAGVNTPELRGGTKGSKAKAIEARDFVEEALCNSHEVIIYTEKDKKGKYGRYIAYVEYNGINLNKELLNLELAEEYKEN